MLDNVQSSPENNGNSQAQTTQPLVQGSEGVKLESSVSTSQTTVVQPAVDANERLWGALSYVPLIALLALIVKPQSNFIKLHARQGLLLMILLLGSTLLLPIVFWPLGFIFSSVLDLLLLLIYIGYSVLSVYSAYLSFIGNWWKIPFLGDIAEKLPVNKFTELATQAITGQQTPSVQDQSNNSTDGKAQS